MATTLVSPGVSVSITDESQYAPAAQGSVPLLVVATASNKADGSGTAIASATTPANAGKLYQVTSQRDLVNLYGSPFFYSTTDGTPLHGYELNEYGLLAAYSALGVSNRCYILRADIDLAGLVGNHSRPAGSPADGTNWYDTTDSTYGIYEFDATLGYFTNKLPMVITDATSMSGNKPLNSIGNVGNYAVNAMDLTGNPTTESEYFYKTINGWVAVGSADWYNEVPTVKGTASNPTLVSGNALTISINGTTNATLTGNTTVTGLAAAINTLSWKYLSATVVDGKLCLFLSAPEGTDVNAVNYLTLSQATGNTILADLGIPFAALTNSGRFNQPSLTYGGSAQMPLWTSSQQYPRPTGSVWLKTNAAGLGATPMVKTFNAQTKTWMNDGVYMAPSDWEMTSYIDASGGSQIAAGTIYAQYGFNDEYKTGPVQLWKRLISGATVVTGTTNVPALGTGGTFKVRVAIPGSGVLSDPYTVTVADSSPTGHAGATEFVTGWSLANIPYTAASKTAAGAIQLTHLQGGEIVLDDFDHTAGHSTGILTAAGFVIGTTSGCKFGPSVVAEWTNVPVFSATLHDGTTPSLGDGNATVNVESAYGKYRVVGSGVSAAGTLYAEGDYLLIKGSALGGVDGANDLHLVVASVSAGGVITAVTERVGFTPAAVKAFTVQLSNWREFSYTANAAAPTSIPADGVTWYYSAIDQIDIMVNKEGHWRGYKELTYDKYGHPVHDETGQKLTDAAGPILAAEAPSAQSDGSAVEYGDLWVDTSDLEHFPKISRWEQVNGVDQWVLINNTDNTSSRGIVFADARWATSGAVSPADGLMPTIVDLLTSDYLDPDAPEAIMYPTGTLLFNTRRSGYNVKHFKWNYFNSVDYPNVTLPTEKSTWVTMSGNKANGAPYMGRHAQRASIVQAMNAAVATNTEIRDEDNYFNLIAAPGYPELQPEMVALNNDRGDTAFIVGDTPFRLSDQATAIQNWATNYYGAASTGDEGMVTRDTYLGVFYPSGITTDLTGKPAVVPASHMMLRTFIKSDGISYPWIAAAGTRRGMIDNASNIGYIDSATGEFQTTKVSVGLRDVMYVNQINPFTFFTGVGLLNYGNKTSYASNSALDRINVARLINYVRYQLNIIVRPFVFEPNDIYTRNQVAAVVSSLMGDLMSKRGLYDYSVVCDESNNTPDRIDRNELWVDVAIEPVKAAEFIYIPVRVVNTGAIGTTH